METLARSLERYESTQKEILSLKQDIDQKFEAINKKFQERVTDSAKEDAKREEDYNKFLDNTDE